MDLDLVWDVIEHDLDTLERTVSILLGPDNEVAAETS